MTSDDKKGSNKAKHDKGLRLSNRIFLLNLSTIARNQVTKSRSAYLGRQVDRYYGSEIEIIDLVKNGCLWVDYDRKSLKRSEIFSLLILDLAAIISGAVLGIFATFTLGDVFFRWGVGGHPFFILHPVFKIIVRNFPMAFAKTNRWEWPRSSSGSWKHAKCVRKHERSKMSWLIEDKTRSWGGR